MKTPLAILALFIVVPVVSSQTPTPSPATQISTTDTLVSFERFDKAEAFGLKRQAGVTGWIGGIGEWSLVDGAAYAKQEGPSKNRPNGHEAVCEHLTDLGDLVFTGEFKLGALRCNAILDQSRLIS